MKKATIKFFYGGISKLTTPPFNLESKEDLEKAKKELINNIEFAFDNKEEFSVTLVHSETL